MSKIVNIHRVDSPFNARVVVPGSKSYSNRALIIAALTRGEVVLRNVLDSDDTRAMIDCLQKLGISLKQNDGTVTVIGDIFDLDQKDVTLDARQSATTLRFLTALSCLTAGTQTLTGHESLLSRPIDSLIESLNNNGAEINRTEHGEIIISSHELDGGIFKLDSSKTSQFLTALLLIAPIIGMEMTLEGPLATGSYIDITKDIMHSFGVDLVSKDKSFVVPKQDYNPREYRIESDISSASYFWALAGISESKITVENTKRDSKQGDIQILQILEKMGAQIEDNESGVSVKGRELKPVEVDMSNCPDQVMTIAVIGAFANGTTVIHGVETLRLKETDRLNAVITELKKMNIATETDGHSLIIHGGNPNSAEIDTYLDHRMAMSFAIAGSRLDKMKIINPEVVSKTFPDFWDKLQSIGVEIS